MSKPTITKDKKTQRPAITMAEEAERLEYLAMLLLEILDEELQESDVEPCIQN